MPSSSPPPEGTSTRSGAAITTELEKAGIPVVQITSAMSIAKMVGSNRVVLGNGIIHVTGDAKLAPEEEKDLRRKLVQKALGRAAIEREVGFQIPSTGAENLCRSPSMALRTNGGILISSKISRSC